MWARRIEPINWRRRWEARNCRICIDSEIPEAEQPLYHSVPLLFGDVLLLGIVKNPR